MRKIQPIFSAAPGSRSAKAARKPRRVTPSAVGHRARSPRQPSRKVSAVQPLIPLEMAVISSRGPGWLRRIWLRGRGYISWALLLCLALLDPGLVLAVLFFAIAAAFSVFCLGVIATSLTTAALLRRWFPGRIKQVLLTPGPLKS